jgi:hypothetical protein
VRPAQKAPQMRNLANSLVVVRAHPMSRQVRRSLSSCVCWRYCTNSRRAAGATTFSQDTFRALPKIIVGASTDKGILGYRLKQFRRKTRNFVSTNI